MSAKAVSELSGKEILYKFFERTGLVHSPYAFHVKTGDDFKQIASSYDWLAKARKGVIKPDQLMKRRGKMGFGKIGSRKELRKWFKTYSGLSFDQCLLHTFIVEPFCAHTEKDEMYIAIFSTREEDTIMFYEQCGDNIGDVEAKARSLKIAVQLTNNAMTPSDAQLETLLGADLPNLEIIMLFVSELYRAYKELHFTYLEINPFVFVNNQIHILDLAAKLDETANFICSDEWRSRHTPMSAPNPVDFPAPFGRARDLTEEEQYIANMDAKTGASLKLTILNRQGRVWTMVAGGGASVVFTDTVCDLGGASELTNYGEYSGDPSESQTFEYAKTMLSIMTEGEPRSDGKVLIIGGSTDSSYNVEKKFKGIVKACETYITKLKEHKVTVYVRHGGPNYQKGLRWLKDAAAKLELPVHVFGPETHMTAIAGAALGTHPLPSVPKEPKTTGQFLLSPERNTAGTERQPSSPAPTSTKVSNPLGKGTFRGLFEDDTKAIIWERKSGMIQEMLDFDVACGRKHPSVVASHCDVFTEREEKKFYFGQKEVLIPAYRGMARALFTHPEATVMVIVESKRSVFETVLEALGFRQLKVIAIIAEGVPENQTRKLLKVAAERGVTLIGPGRVGAIKPGCFKIGHIGGMMDNILSSKLYRPGSVAYVLRSAEMANELNNIISQNTNGVYEGIAIGGDRYPGSTYTEHIERYQADDRVKMIVLLGEVGGTEEYKIVDMLNKGLITKPLVAWCIGTCADHITSDVQFGHAGASANSNGETAACKNAALRSVGAIVPSSFGELGNKICETYDKLVANGTIVPQAEVPPPPVPMDYAWARELKLIRKPMTSICDERGEELIYGGVPITEGLESELGVGGVLGLLWFQKSLPEYANEFIELSLLLTADLGPCAPPAGKDLISSLTSGLLTIGDRFGGALDGAARQFSNAMDNGWSPMQFVNEMGIQKEHIMGIGHRVKSINNPDKRVEILKIFVMKRFTQETPLLKFALEVEKITTAEQNLILNVDGAIGVIFVDILRQSKLFTPAEAQETIEIGRLDGLFALGRSIGCLGCLGINWINLI